MALVMRSTSSGLISRYGKTDMKISWGCDHPSGLVKRTQRECAKEAPTGNGASGSSRDSYDRAQFNMTCIPVFFSQWWLTTIGLLACGVCLITDLVRCRLFLGMVYCCAG